MGKKGEGNLQIRILIKYLWNFLFALMLCLPIVYVSSFGFRCKYPQLMYYLIIFIDVIEKNICSFELLHVSSTNQLNILCLQNRKEIKFLHYRVQYNSK